MQLRETLIGVCWVAWVLIWIITAAAYRSASRDPSPRSSGRARLRAYRLVLVVLVVAAVRSQHLGDRSPGHGIGWLGVALCVAGIAVATWARICLGRNWGMPMTVRAHPTLIRRGPYRVVRHPIYSGLLLAMVGSVLAAGPGWLVGLVGAGAYFVMSLRVEEADMAALFPDDYPEYARHTKRLVPFVY